MHLKIVVDVIKDTANTGGGREGAGYGSDSSKEDGFASASPESSIWASCDLQTRWHKGEETHKHAHVQRGGGGVIGALRKTTASVTDLHSRRSVKTFL